MINFFKLWYSFYLYQNTENIKKHYCNFLLFKVRYFSNKGHIYYNHWFYTILRVGDRRQFRIEWLYCYFFYTVCIDVLKTTMMEQSPWLSCTKILIFAKYNIASTCHLGERLFTFIEILWPKVIHIYWCDAYECR